MWASMLSDFVNGIGLYTLLSEGPTYMADVLNFPIEYVSLHHGKVIGLKVHNIFYGLHIKFFINTACLQPLNLFTKKN